MFAFLDGLSGKTDWQKVSEDVYERPMGLLERRFDLGSSDQGRSDTLARVFVSAPDMETKRALVSRLPLAWSILRVASPSLCATSHPATTGDRNDQDEAGGGNAVYPRKFRFKAVQTVEEAFSAGQKTLSTEELPRKGFKEAVLAKELAFRNAVNRPLLWHTECLAKLLVYDAHGDGLDIAVFLVISHTISDGMSIMRLLKNLFTFACDPALPLSLTDSQMSSWLGHLLRDQVARLPLASESLYPNVPVWQSEKSTARVRWFWAIEYTLLRARARRKARAPQLPRKEPIGEKRANSFWLPLVFPRDVSDRFIRLSRSNKLSPSMAMYAVVAMALSRIVETTRQGGTAAYQPIIIGFPFSLRPFLDVGSHPQTDADAAIRITFGSITLPFDACARGSAARVRRVVWRGARLATEQFKERFDPAHRSSFLASAYLTNVDLFKRTLGRNSDPIQAPKSVINASMVGDLDRLLPSSFAFAGQGQGQGQETVKVELSDFSIGTRLHVGEGMLMECWTWAGRLTVNLGVDDLVFDLRQGQNILDEIRAIVQTVVAP